MNYIRVDKDGEEAYIPIIASKKRDEEGKEAHIIAVPGDAQKYLRKIGYLPRDTGLILFTETKPKNAKTIIPVVVKEGGKIALTEWLERFLHKNPEYREKYLIHTGRSHVLNWEQLDRDRVVLVVTVRKFGAEFKEESELEPDEYSRRTILLKPHVQGIVRTRVGDIAGVDEIVLCEFQLEVRRNVLEDKEAEDILLNEYGVREEIVEKLARRLSGVMLCSDEQGEGLPDNEKGAWVEWKHFQIIQEYDEVVDYQKEIEGAVMDFVSKSNLLIDSKFRKKLIKMEMEGLLRQMAAYKKEWEKYRARDIRAKVVFSFKSRLSNDDYEFLIGKVKDRFGKNWKEWLNICNGIDEFEAFIRKWVGK